MKLDVIINSLKWGFITGLIFLLAKISLQSGGTYVILGISQGAVGSIVLGTILLVIGLTLIHVLVMLIMHWIDI